MTVKRNHNHEKKSFDTPKPGVLFRTFRPLMLAIDHLLKKRRLQRKIMKDKNKKRQLNEFAIN